MELTSGIHCAVRWCMMQPRTEIDMKRLVQVWDGRETEPLRFTEIMKAVGWNKRKTFDMLEKAVAEGYLEKRGVGRSVLYRNRIADYKGYFNALQFLWKVDAVSRKNGTMVTSDQYLYGLIPFHVLAYGTPQADQLTPLEREILHTILGGLASDFHQYVEFCRAVSKRREVEMTHELPETATNTLFADDDEEATGPLSIPAANALYGDVLWEHIFFKIVWNIRFALEKASLDFAGPIELYNSIQAFTDLAMKLAKDVYDGKLSAYEDPDPKTTEKLEAIREREDPFEEGPRDYAVVLTPSPESMDEFATQVGKIVMDKYRSWAHSDFFEKYVKEKGKTIWADVFDFGGGPRTRKDILRVSLSDTLASMRCGIEPPFSGSDKKFMLKDRNLTEVFSQDEILQIISNVEGIIGRARRFYDLIDGGKSLKELKKDPEWFTDEELHEFHLAQNVDISADWQDEFGTSGPISFEIPQDAGTDDRIAEGVQAKVRKELSRRGAKRKGEPKPSK